jgi:hypothetical protein
MAKIPTIQASEGIRTGSTGPHAEPGSFGAAYDMGGSALQLSRGMRSMTGDVLAVREAKRQTDEARWINESYDLEQKYLHDWSKSKIDARDENMAEEYWKHAHERIKLYTEKAPSKRAATQYQAQILHKIQGQYASLAKTAEDIRIENTVTSINSQIQNALGIYRDAREMPNSNSIIDLNGEYQRLQKYIDDSFGKMAPGEAMKLKEHLATELALGTMDYNPAYAKMIIDTDKNLDERTRTYLTNQLQQSQRDGNRLLADEFTRARKDHLVKVEAGLTAQKLPQEQYTKLYGPVDGVREKRDDDFAVDVYVRANQFMDKYGGWNAGALSQAYRKLESERKTNEDKAVLGILSDRVRQSVQLQAKDRVAWLSQNNPEVKRLTREEVEAATPEARKTARSAKNFAMLKYQGYAPNDAADPELYLGLATDDRSLLSTDEAEKSARIINTGKASEVIDKVTQMFQMFPDEEHRYIAFKDLTTLPAAGKEINRMYQLVWTHRDKWWVDTLIGAIDNAKGLDRLTPESMNKLNEKIMSNATWIQFQRTMVGDNAQGTSDVEAYREAIGTFANYFMTNQKMDEKQAVNKSVDLLLKSELGFTSVNGQPLAITKQRPDGHFRTDEEIQDYGRRLEVALEHLDPRYVDARNFPALKQFQLDENKWNNFYQQLREKGFFRLSQDGQYVTIYYPDDLGIPFQLTDDQRRPFMIYLDELPVFHRTSPITGPIGGTTPIYPEKRDIYEVEGNYLGLGHILGTRTTRTNWPGLPMWMRNAPRTAPNVYPTPGGPKEYGPGTYKTP